MCQDDAHPTLPPPRRPKLSLARSFGELMPAGMNRTAGFELASDRRIAYRPGGRAYGGPTLTSGWSDTCRGLRPNDFSDAMPVTCHFRSRHCRELTVSALDDPPSFVLVLTDVECAVRHIEPPECLRRQLLDRGELGPAELSEWVGPSPVVRLRDYRPAIAE